METLKINPALQKSYEKQVEALEAFYRAEMAYKHESIKEATSYLDRMFKVVSQGFHNALKFISFKRLIRLSVYLNRFSKLLATYKKNTWLTAEDNSLEAQILASYWKCKWAGEPFPLEEYRQGIQEADELGVFLYVVAQLVTEDDLKKSYLITACQKNKLHLGALAQLVSLGVEPDLLQLKKLYENEEQLFTKFFKAKEIGITKGTSRKVDIAFTPLGGGNDIGASCYLLQIGAYNLLIDVGVKVKKEGEDYPNFEKLEALCPLDQLTMVIITHAHLDHVGGILELYKRHTNLTFVMTKETKALLSVNLGVKQGGETYYLLEELLEKIVVLEFNKPLKIGKEGLVLELYPAGHILGAAALWIQSRLGNVFMTSDYCLEHQHTVRGLEAANLPVDVLITENTYGDCHEDRRPSRKQVEAELVNYVVKKINEGKKVLIPAFAIGRSQELICMLKDAARAHQFRLYIDGQVQEVNKIYEAASEFSALGQNIYNVSNGRYKSKQDFITEEFLNNRSCVITSSGMLEEGSASAEYAKQILGRSDGVCILTGFQAMDTVGYKLKTQMALACERYITIDEIYYKIQAELQQFNLSAHCDIPEILAVATKLRPRYVILIHGECKQEKSYIHTVLEQVTHTIQSKNLNTIKIKEAEDER